MARAEVVEYTAEHDGGDSTSIDHIWYNRNSHRMTVRFSAKGNAPGGTYSYDDVSLSLYEDFIKAESLGQFFREVFRRPGNPWPGAKHDDRRTTFQQVDPEPARPEPDLDAMKTVRLTSGKGRSTFCDTPTRPKVRQRSGPSRPSRPRKCLRNTCGRRALPPASSRLSLTCPDALVIWSISATMDV
jgi:hypothetical protein